MKAYYLLLLCGAVFLSNALSAQNDKLIMLESDKWKLIDYRNADGTLIADDLKPNYGNENGVKFITIRFANDTAYSFTTYTNDGWGRIYVNTKTDSLSIKKWMMSQVREYPWGELFLKTLPSVNRYEVSDVDLKLKYDNGTKYMHFIK